MFLNYKKEIMKSDRNWFHYSKKQELSNIQFDGIGILMF